MSPKGDVYERPGSVYAEPWEPWVDPGFLVYGPGSCWDETLAVVAQVSQGRPMQTADEL